jgi:hypothetical protein
MTAVATSARTALQELAEAATVLLSPTVTCYDHAPAPGDTLGPVAVVVEQQGRTFWDERLKVTVLVSTATLTATAAQEALEATVETLDEWMRKGLAAGYDFSRWLFEWQEQIASFVASTTVRVLRDGGLTWSTPSTTRDPVMTTARSAIASAVTSAVATLTPLPAVYAQEPYPGGQAGPWSVAIAPATLDFDAAFLHVLAVVTGEPISDAQTRLDDLVEAVDGAIRDLGAGYGLVDWDSVGWSDDLEAWVAQCPVQIMRSPAW